jgi:hypothetical protein
MGLRKAKPSVTVTVRRQRAIEGRIRAGVGMDPRVFARVEREARRWGVSIPFLFSVMASDCLGIDLEPDDRFGKTYIHMPDIRRVK